MTVYSPCPQSKYLKTTLPDLCALPTNDPVLQYSVCAQQEALTSGANPYNADWWLGSAAFAFTFGRFTAATEAAARAVRLALPAGRVEAVAEAWTIQAGVRLYEGDFGIVRHLTDQIGIFAGSGAGTRIEAFYSELEGQLLLQTGNLATGEFAEAEMSFERAVEQYRACGDAAGETRAFEGWARTWAGLGNYSRAVDCADAGLARCQETGEWRNCGGLLLVAASALSDAGYRDEVSELFDLALDWSDYVGNRLNHIQSLCGKGRLFCYQMEPGAEQEALWRSAPLHRALEEANAIGARPLAAFCHVTLAFIYEKAGDRIAQEYHRFRVRE